MKTKTPSRTDLKCPYCAGNGYYHLLLGGTETCPHCKGTGKQPEEECPGESGSGY